MSEHTPGPWIFDPNNTGMTPHAGYGIYDRDFYSGREIVYVLCSIAKERELGEGACEANARLIAAAPDLLDALKEITYQAVSWHRFHHGCKHVSCDAICAAIPQCEAAIAKAEGAQ